MTKQLLSKFGAELTFVVWVGLTAGTAFAAKTIILIDDDTKLTECVEWLHQSPQVVSRIQSLKLCQKGVTVECMKMVYQDPKVYSRLKAAEICAE